jgi:uncharacterized protein YbaP (TraB family)
MVHRDGASAYVYCLACAVTLILAACTVPPEKHSNGPALYVVERGEAKVYIFGGAAPRDRRWLTPTIESALRESTELWQENPRTPRDPSEIDEWETLGKRSSGSLFDDLSPDEAARLMRIASTLGVTREELEPYRSWAAPRVLTSRFWPKALASTKLDDVEGVLLRIAGQQHIPIHSEYATRNDFPRFFASLSNRAQVQWLSYQLDFMERPLHTILRSGDAWADGDVSGLLSVQTELRTRYPDLYAAIETSRNEKWAERIAKMLSEGGVHFIDVPVQHVLGPESIQAHVKRHGMRVRRV